MFVLREKVTRTRENKRTTTNQTNRNRIMKRCMFDWIWLKQRGYSQPKATSLSGTMLASLSLLFCLPPADSLTVKAASGRPGIYVSVLTADMQTPVPPAQACRASWPRCDEHVKPCRTAGERSINPQVSGPLTLYIPAAPHSPPYSSLRSSKLKRKTSGSVNQGWKLCSLTGPNLQNVHVLKPL